MTRTTENGASTLLARLANDPAAIERICNTLQRDGQPPTDHATIRRALLAAAEECAVPSEADRASCR